MIHLLKHLIFWRKNSEDKAPEAHEYDYDLVTIGGGSGGVRASRFAAVNAGKKVAVIELPFDPLSSATSGGLGGTCVIRGCVPKKLFVFGSGYQHDFQDARGFGWEFSEPKLDWKVLQAKKHSEIARLNGIYGSMLSNAKVASIVGSGKLLDNHTVQVTAPDGSVSNVTAAHILIATGGTANKLNIPGAELGITSDEALIIDEVPKKVVVLGGGFIAVEFAGIFNASGTETHIVYRQPTPLRGFDEDVRNAVGENLTKRGVHVHASTNPVKIEKMASGKLSLTLDAGEPIVECDIVMFATGRSPNTNRPDLGLKEVGVELNKDGAVKVDEFSRTTVDCVWAVGDVTNRINLTPVALMEGGAFVATCFQSNPTKPDYHYVPSAVFCQPPVGTVGMTEEEVIKKGMCCDVYVSSFKPMKAALSGRDEKYLLKMIVDVPTDKVVGIHMVGADSSEIMQGFGVALKCGCTKKQLDSTVGIHPSSAEEFVTMRTPTRRVGKL